MNLINYRGHSRRYINEGYCKVAKMRRELIELKTCILVLNSFLNIIPPVQISTSDMPKQTMHEVLLNVIFLLNFR